MRGTSRSIVALTVFLWPFAARAEEAPPIFSFAQPSSAQPSSSQEPSFWNGLYVGSEMFVVSGKGAKGGVGGGGVMGYDRAFPDNVVLGVEASAGYSPALFSQRSFSGFDYASANIRVGYDMGRWMPFVTTGVVLVKPDMAGRGFVSPADSFNGLFDQSASIKGFATMGAGVDYAITDKLKVGVEISTGNGRGFWVP